MRYFTPEIDVGVDAPEKLGGYPAGLPAARWPRCACCGGAMSLVGQFAYHPDRLDLGADGRMLFVFMCDNDPGMCDTWEAEAGANACLVVPAQQLGGEEAIDPLPPAWHEAAITGWTSRNDAVTEETAPLFFGDPHAPVPAPAPPDTVRNTVPLETRLGSVPTWLQSDEEGPGAGWDFLGQIDSLMRFRRPPGRIEPWMSPAKEDDADGVLHYADGPNFGDGGVAYLFADRRVDPPRVIMFWQGL